MKRNARLMIAGGAAGAVNGLFGAGGGMLLVPLLTVMTDIEEETVETEEKGLETWAIVLIVAGSVIVAAGIAVGVIFLVKAQNKKKEAARKAAETVNLAKRKIDTTDDKSIDVYADEAETVEIHEVSQEAEVAAEETVEEAVEAEEVVEEVAEEAQAEEATEEPKQD